MAYSFDFVLCIDTERFEREGVFQMSGYSYFEHGDYREDECYAGMELTKHITLIDIMRTADGMPVGLHMFCKEAEFGQEPQIIERELLMGDELYVCNVNYFKDYYYRLRLKRTIRYEDFMKDALIWVDEKDNETGYGEKLATHRDRILHRAFSVFIYNWRDRKMLLQCRADDKYHSGGLWCNACCSHPRFGETMIQTINNRLREELGLNCELKIADPYYSGRGIDVNHTLFTCGTLIYHSDLGNIGEDEVDHVFLLFTDRADCSEAQTIPFSHDEIKTIRWMSIHDIEADFTRNPNAYSVWFQPAYKCALKVLKSQASYRKIDIDT